MRKVVSESWLRDEINAHMGGYVYGAGCRVVRSNGTGTGPNWRFSFNPAAVPAGYVANWERIRHKFEDAYNLPDE
jgi:hypothetical protein